MLSAKRFEIFCKWKRSQRREIEVRVVPPHECFHFEIEVDLVEEAQIAQRPLEFAASHESGINDLRVIIVEANAQNVWADDFESHARIELMQHLANGNPR